MNNKDTVISVQELGKCYKLGATHSHDTLRDKIAHGANVLASCLGQKGREAKRGRDLVSRQPPKEMWALKGVSFDIRRGEVLGVIGGNGAGKSTLLKILSGITDPSEGEVRMRGRVASLLEVGTGMHPELSGRENIFLNGAILGMRKEEIDSKYDQIVEFAGIADFMSTPIKRYSSGMRVRLGFSIAAHLEPEILVIDEVLAVGDVAFQRKCLGRMESIAGQGRTVLFVSHDMGAINQLCSRAIMLENGQVCEEGETSSVVDSYLSRSNASYEGFDGQIRAGEDGDYSPYKIALKVKGNLTKVVPLNGALEILIWIKKKNTTRNARLDIHVEDATTGRRVFTVTTLQRSDNFLDSDDSDICAKCQLPNMPLVPGAYVITLSYSCNSGPTNYIPGVCSFNVFVPDGLDVKYVLSPSKGPLWLEPLWELQKSEILNK